MKATGIVRRIDDLGRVVIPKEIRRTQLIRVGDPLEIFVSGEGEVIFKKYSPIGELAAFAQNYAEALQRTAGVRVVVADRDRVVAAVSGARELLERRVTQEYENAVETRRLYQCEPPLTICEGQEALSTSAIAPVLCQGDIVGSIALVGQQNVSLETAQALISVAAAVLGKHMET